MNKLYRRIIMVCLLFGGLNLTVVLIVSLFFMVLFEVIFVKKFNTN